MVRLALSANSFLADVCHGMISSWSVEWLVVGGLLLSCLAFITHYLVGT